MRPEKVTSIASTERSERLKLSAKFMSLGRRFTRAIEFLLENSLRAQFCGFQRKCYIRDSEKKEESSIEAFVIRLVFHNDHIDALNISVTRRLGSCFFSSFSLALVSLRFFI